MKKINNLIYALEINHINNSGLKISIFVQFNDDGLKIKSVKVGDVCVTEETINGRSIKKIVRYVPKLWWVFNRRNL